MGVGVVGGAVGGPAGVPDAGGRGRERASRRAPCRGWRACRPACRRAIVPVVDQRDARRSRSRGTPAAAGPRSRRPGPAARRRTPRFRTWRRVYGAWRAVRRRRDCKNRRHAAATSRATTGREPSPYVELDRAAWAALRRARPRSPLTEERSSGVRGLGDELDLDEVPQVYLPLSRLLSLYVEAAGAAAPRSRRSSSHRPPAAAHAVRHRGRRLGGGRQVHDRPRAPADAGPLARAPPRRAGHHRRVPAPQRRARSGAGCCTARASRSPTTAGRCCGSSIDIKSGKDEVEAPIVLPPASTTSCPTRRSWSSSPTSSSSRGSTSCSRRGSAATAAPASAVSDFFDFSVYVDAADQRHPAVVHRPLPPAARDRLPRPGVVLREVRRAHRTTRRSPRPSRSGTRSTAPT